jgi:hypothetical protein
MLQSGREFDFAEEALGAESLRQLRMEHFERNGAVMAEVVGEIYHGHATAAELALDAVLAGERGMKPVQTSGQADPVREKLGGRLQR